MPTSSKDLISAESTSNASGGTPTTTLSSSVTVTTINHDFAVPSGDQEGTVYRFDVVVVDKVGNSTTKTVYAKKHNKAPEVTTIKVDVGSSQEADSGKTVSLDDNTPVYLKTKDETSTSDTSSVVLSGSAKEEGLLVEFRDGDGNLLGTTLTGDKGTFSGSFDNKFTGGYGLGGTKKKSGRTNITVNIIDKAGNVAQSVVTVVLDNEAPVVTDFKVDDVAVAKGEKIGSKPRMSFTVRDDQEVDTGSIVMKMDGVTVNDGFDTTKRYDSLSTASGDARIVYQVKAALLEGKHVITINAADKAGNKATTYTMSDLTVSSSTDESAVQGPVLPYPTVFNPTTGGTTKITYTLNKEEAVEARIYSIRGEMLWKRTYLATTEGGKAGYNEVPWDGKSDFGEIVPNDIYLVYITRSSDHKTIGKGKIIVLR